MVKFNTGKESIAVSLTEHLNSTQVKLKMFLCQINWFLGKWGTLQNQYKLNVMANHDDEYSNSVVVSIGP